MDCPKCNTHMYHDGYLVEITQALSEVQIICKDDDLRKKQFPLKYFVCPNCGYIEAYADVEVKKREIRSIQGKINKEAIIDKEAEKKRKARIKGSITKSTKKRGPSKPKKTTKK